MTNVSIMYNIINYGNVFNDKKFSRLIALVATHKVTSFKVTAFKGSAMESVLQLYNPLVTSN